MLEGYAYCQILLDHDQPQDFIYIDVNNACEVLTGLKNVVGKKVSEVIPGIQESNPELFEIYGRVALTGKPEIFETYLESLGIWFSIAVYSPRREYFVAVFDNITERKRAEEALRETSDYLENLLNYANAPIIVWDAGFTITKFNPAFDHMPAYTSEEIIGKPLNVLFPADSREDSLSLIKQTSSGDRWESVEIPILHRDGNIRIALWNSTNLYDPNSQKLIATIAQGQ